jgi:hypothetical protein
MQKIELKNAKGEFRTNAGQGYTGNWAEYAAIQDFLQNIDCTAQQSFPHSNKYWTLKNGTTTAELTVKVQNCSNSACEVPHLHIVKYKIKTL